MTPKDYIQHIPEHHVYCHDTNGLHTTYPRTPRYCRHTNGLHTTYPRTPRLLSSHQWTTYNISPNTTFIVVTPMDYIQHIPEHHVYCRHTNGLHTTYPRTPRLLSSHQRTTYNISPNTTFIVVTPTELHTTISPNTTFIVVTPMDYIQHIPEHHVYCRHTKGLHTTYPRIPRLLSSHQRTTYNISPNTTFIVVTPKDYIQHIPEYHVYCRHTNGLHTTYPRTPRLLSSRQRTTYNISPNTTFIVVTPKDYIQHIPEHHVYCRHTKGLHTTYPEHHVYCRHTKGIHTTYPQIPRLLSSHQRTTYNISPNTTLLSSHQRTTYNISPNTTFIVVTPKDYIQHIPEYHVYCRHTKGLHTTYPRTPRLLSSHQRTTYNISPNTTFIVVTPKDYIQHIPEHHVYCRHTKGLHTTYPRIPRLLSSHQRTTYNISPNTTFIVVTPKDYIQHIPEHHIYCRHTKGLHTTYPRIPRLLSSHQRTTYNISRIPRLLSSHQRTTYNISPNTTFIVVTPKDYIQHIPEHHVYCRHTKGLLHTTYPRTPRLLSSHQWTTYNISSNITFIVVTPTDYIQHIPEHHVYCRHTNEHYIQHIPENHVYCRHTNGLHTTYPRTPRLLSSHQRTLHTTYPRKPRLLSSHQRITYNISPNTTFIVVTPTDYIQHIPEHHVYCHHTNGLHTTYPRTPRLLS